MNKAKKAESAPVGETPMPRRMLDATPAAFVLKPRKMVS
jgi:hypothetical protein